MPGTRVWRAESHPRKLQEFSHYAGSEDKLALLLSAACSISFGPHCARGIGDVVPGFWHTFRAWCSPGCTRLFGGPNAPDSLEARMCPTVLSPDCARSISRECFSPSLPTQRPFWLVSRGRSSVVLIVR
ncbi:hypothetical protein BU26DRAFT_14455 [Trematosphaeria pertusa]|uniref:Uncharacterized protein n=1 Tax=Trematosphaeria pertusa TaxID=390896 RepID=A0A6A6IZS9_9PLEO|nr:uncharacterized protein BU26DRAFT_14455 [Trematosphaeria pertusa]KAF2256111.1 hypothetical protein BU26DRAFT_14455 [Trematosphaeria pertusa]